MRTRLQELTAKRRALQQSRPPVGVPPDCQAKLQKAFSIAESGITLKREGMTRGKKAIGGTAAVALTAAALWASQDTFRRVLGWEGTGQQEEEEEFLEL